MNEIKAAIKIDEILQGIGPYSIHDKMTDSFSILSIGSIITSHTLIFRKYLNKHNLIIVEKRRWFTISIIRSYFIFDILKEKKETLFQCKRWLTLSLQISHQISKKFKNCDLWIINCVKFYRRYIDRWICSYYSFYIVRLVVQVKHCNQVLFTKILYSWLIFKFGTLNILYCSLTLASVHSGWLTRMTKIWVIS